MPEIKQIVTLPASLKPLETCAVIQLTTGEKLRSVVGQVGSPAAQTTAAVSFHQKTWKNGRTLKISFENKMRDRGDQLIARIKKEVNHYFSMIGLKVEWVDARQGDIRISFTRGGSWSYIGTDALGISKDQPTVQLGWLTAESRDEELGRVVYHEILGHALGIGHEQKSPKSSIPWDKPKVYDYYMGPPNNWSKAQVDHNVLGSYEPGEVNATAFDPKSIMLYPVRNALTVGDYEIGWNTKPSKTDIEHLQDLYPKANEPSNKKRLRERLSLLISRRNTFRRRVKNLTLRIKRIRARLKGSA